MFSAFSIDALEPILDFQTSITFLLVDKTQIVGTHFLNKIARSILVIQLSRFAGFSFDQHGTLCNVIINMS